MTAERFRESYASLALACSIPGHKNAGADVLKLVSSWIETSTKGQWLLIVDNADDAELFRSSGALQKYIPESSRVSLLITTRNRQAAQVLAPGRPLIEVGSMTDDESRKMLCATLQRSDISPADLSDLADRLHRLPLPLFQAASYIDALSISVRKYLELLNKDPNDRRLLELLSGDFEPVSRHSDTLRAVAETWFLSFEQLQTQDPVAAELLSLICLYDKDRIPEKLAQAYLEDQAQERGDDDSDVELVVIKALGSLVSFSFISQSHNETLNMHRLVQLVTRKWLKHQGTLSRFASHAMFALSACFPQGEYEHWEACSRYLPHVESALKFPGVSTGEEALERADLLFRKAQYLFGQGRWEEAEKDLLSSLNVNRRELGNDHPDTLAAMDVLGSIYAKQHRWNDAETLQLEAWDIRKEALGPGHTDTLTSMDNLASTYRSQDRLEEVEQLESVIFEGRRALMDAKSPATLASMNNLALTLRRQGRLQQAEMVLTQVLDLCRTELGAQHPSTVTSMSNLALVYWDQERHSEAEALESDALEARKEVLGLDHPDTLSSMHQLSWTWWAMGRKQQAFDLLRDCAVRREKALGVAHPDALASRGLLSTWASGYEEKLIGPLERSRI